MKIDEKVKKLAKAKLKYLSISPRKVRKIADTIRGLPILEAESELLYRPQRAAKPILKLLRSVISNIEDKNIKKESLFVDEIRVDKGPVSKRIFPRAKGRRDIIKHRSSHIFITLGDSKKKISKRKYKTPSLKMIKSDKFISRFNKEELKKDKKDKK